MLNACACYLYYMEFDTPYVHLRIKNNILVGTYKRGIHINLEAAKTIVQSRIFFTGNKPMPSLIISHGIISMDKPARDYLASAEATAGLVASAIVVGSPFSAFLGRFFLKVHKPGTMPVKIFSNLSSAEKWLQQFIAAE